MVCLSILERLSFFGGMLDHLVIDFPLLQKQIDTDKLIKPKPTDQIKKKLNSLMCVI